MQRFLHTFLAEPVVGAFAGLDRARIELLAVAKVTSGPGRAWIRHGKAVESVGVVWPFIRLVANGAAMNLSLVRAVGELLLFTCGVDAYLESMWRRRASPLALNFETQWRETSPAKFLDWRRDNPESAPPPVTRLSARTASLGRLLAQAHEARSGSVWPDLPCVRTFINDSHANGVNSTRAAKARNNRAALDAELNAVLGADDCRHSFNMSDVFMPGIENFLCPCGLLIGVDFLDQAESPSHVLAALVQRFPVLPQVVYFDTACQLSRNAFRRVPWLMNKSATACSVDRVHNVGDQHKCSDIFDADKFPSRSAHDCTAAAESRHSINKAFKTHLSHLR